MPRVVLASQLARWLPPGAAAGGERGTEVEGDTVAAVLEHYFAIHPTLRGYVLDERGAVRQHVAIFVDGRSIGDKRALAAPVGAGGEVHVMQALSGG